MIAEALMRRSFRIAQWQEVTAHLVAPLMERLWLLGAIEQLALLNITLRGTEALLAQRSLSWAPFWRFKGYTDEPELVSVDIGSRTKQTFAEERLRELGLSVPPGVDVDIPPFMAERMGAAVRELSDADFWAGLSQTTRKDFLKVLQDGIANGKSVRTIAKEIQSVGPEYSKIRATRVARTECLPADTVVNGALATAAYRRWYEGEMVQVVTNAGRKFTGTPNHPMLTTRGWIPLGQLLESDHLVCNQIDVEQSRSPGDKDVDAPPAMIGEIFDSLSAVIVPCRERTGEPDFHGDGMNGDVDVLRPNGVLRIGDFIPINQSLEKHVFSPATLRSIISAAQSAPFSRGPAVDVGHALLERANLATVAANGHTDVPRIGVKLLSKRQRAFTGFVPSNDFGWDFGGAAAIAAGHQQIARLGTRPPHPGLATSSHNRVSSPTSRCRNGIVAHARNVQLDGVRSLRRIEWLGHVYNLTTTDGYFCANGLYTGNTTGIMNRGTLDTLEAAEEQTAGAIAGKRWVAIIDDVVRFSHEDTHGQVRRNSEPFTTGLGNQGMHPGDVALPVEDRVNCRCAMLSATAAEVME